MGEARTGGYEGGVNVMVVDDAEGVRARVAALCADVPGVERMHEAAGGTDARAVLESERVHAVVLDLHLRGESGFALLSEIKRSYTEVTVIVLTNDASDHHRRSCHALGADHFFDKSSEFEALVPVLAGLVPQCARELP